MIKTKIQNLSTTSNNFDLIHEKVSESLFDENIHSALLRAIKSNNQDDLLVYAEKQLNFIKGVDMNKSISLATVVNFTAARNEITRQQAITNIAPFLNVYAELFPDDHRPRFLLKAMNTEQKTSDVAKKMIHDVLDDINREIQTASLLEVNNYRSARCVADAIKFCTDDIVDMDKIMHELQHVINLSNSSVSH